MSKITIAIILGFILSLVCAILADASGKVVFVEFVGAGKGYHICTMNPDGTDVRRLTKKPGQYDSPRWSPDGTKIVYYKMEGRESQLWMMDADGTSPELLYKAAYWGASWSPDGKRIAFTTNGRIVIMDLQTRKTVPLVEGVMPVWSPDGSAIAYESSRPPHAMLHLIDPETGRKWGVKPEEKGLSISHKHWADIAWSPDGKQIAFLGMILNRNWWGIYIMDSDGTNVIEKYTGDGGNLVAICPTWSPDGKQVLFQTPKGIERMDVDGKFPKLVYAGGTQPNWTRPPATAVNLEEKVATTWGYVRRDMLQE